MRSFVVGFLALGSLTLASQVEAQLRAVPASRGMAWVGCWEAADGLPSRGITCVIPADPAALRIVSIAADGSSSEATLRLNGQRTPVDAKGCTGWEVARLSDDGDRLINESEITCAETPRQIRSGAFVITPTGDWLEVQGVGFATISSAQVRRYRSVITLAGIPVDVRDAVAPFLGEAEIARGATQHRSVSARDVLELKASGVAAPVIDIVVGAGYPKSFVIDAGGGTAIAESDRGNINGPTTPYDRYFGGYGSPMLSFLDLGLLNDCSRFGWGAFGSPFCNGYSMYGYNRYGTYNGMYTGAYWPGFGIPVVVRPIVVVTGTTAAGSGSAVKGRGYTQGGAVREGGGQPRYSPTTSRDGGSAGSSSGSPAAGSSSGGSSGAAPARTAKPRDP